MPEDEDKTSEIDTIRTKVNALSGEQRYKLLSMAKPRIVEGYIEHIPHATQQLFLTLNEIEEVMYGGAAGGGKQTSVDTRVLTPKGWVRNGDLKVGNSVVDPRTGKSCSILLAHPITETQVWEVEFEDGQIIEACEDHLWTVRMSGKRTKGWDSRNKIGDTDSWLNGYKVVTTKLLYDAIQRVKKQTKDGSRRNYPHVPISRAIEFTRPYRNIDSTLSINPYILGLLLGDGHVTNSGSVSIATDDNYIREQVTSWAKNIGYEIRNDWRNKTFSSIYINNSKDFNNSIKKYGLVGKRSWDKFIPEDYLFAPLEVRIRLMQGLMDTDGYVDVRGHMSYTTVSKQLADDVQHLARSLGAKVSITSKKTAYTHKGEKLVGRLAYTVWITPHDPKIFVSLPRKLNRAIKQQNIPTREVVDVRKTNRTIEMRCITVDTIDGLYVIEGFVVTHNSDALLMAALQFVDVPGYSALLLRRTWADLMLPGAIMERATAWLSKTDAQPKDGGRTWVFPSGAKITFGYLQYDKDKFRYQSAEFQFVGFDELTQFSQETYEFLFSRIRRPSMACLTCKTSLRKEGIAYVHSDKSVNCKHTVPDPKVLAQYPPAKDGITLFDVPLRMRSATNPGGIGHAWVRDYFVNKKTRNPEAIFIPALLKDNPSIDQESYIKNLSHLGALDRERLLNGDWDVSVEGLIFQRHWFQPIAEAPVDAKYCRFWDTAATVDGDWTVGLKLGLTKSGQWVIADVQRARLTSEKVERLVQQTAAVDGIGVRIRMEQEGGSSGLAIINHYKRNVLLGYDFDGDRPTGAKEVRAVPVATAAESGNVFMVHGQWNKDFLDEISTFPMTGAHDDQVDALSGAFGILAFGRRARLLV